MIAIGLNVPTSNAIKNKVTQLVEYPRVSRERVRFKTTAASGSLAGTFNDWDGTSRPLLDINGNGHYQADVPLLPGPHEYRLVIKDVWIADSDCPRWIVNEYGALNSIVEISSEPELLS